MPSGFSMIRARRLDQDQECQVHILKRTYNESRRNLTFEDSEECGGGDTGVVCGGRRGPFRESGPHIGKLALGVKSDGEDDSLQHGHGFAMNFDSSTAKETKTTMADRPFPFKMRT